MEQFKHVVEALRGWLLSIPQAKKLMPHHMNLLYAGLGLTYLVEFYWEFTGVWFNILTQIMNTLGVLGFWAFIAGALLTLVSQEKKYLAICVWIFALHYIVPSMYFGISNLINLIVYAFIGWQLHLYLKSTEQTGSDG